LTIHTLFDLDLPVDGLGPGCTVNLHLRGGTQGTLQIATTAQIASKAEAQMLASGGLLPQMMQKLATTGEQARLPQVASTALGTQSE